MLMIMILLSLKYETDYSEAYHNSLASLLGQPWQNMAWEGRPSTRDWARSEFPCIFSRRVPYWSHRHYHDLRFRPSRSLIDSPVCENPRLYLSHYLFLMHFCHYNSFLIKPKYEPKFKLSILWANFYQFYLINLLFRDRDNFMKRHFDVWRLTFINRASVTVVDRRKCWWLIKRTLMTGRF